MDNLKQLPKPEKQVVAKVLVDKGFSLREVERILGVSDSSVLKYSKLETPEELKQFQAELEVQFKTKESIVAAKALAVMDEKITRARISEALEVYKAMRGNSNQGSVNVQINNVLEDKKSQYGI